MRHFLTLLDLTPDEIRYLLEEAERLKMDLKRGRREPLLQGRVLGLLFEKPSLRTHVSFRTAMAHLGGTSLFLPAADTGMGSREPVPDFARVMSQYVDGVVLRTFRHETIETFAAHSSCPVINGLSDYDHPCQALGDLLTLREVFSDLEGRTLAFVGDGNNVARSLAVACGKVGVRFVLAAPNGYGFDGPFLEKYRRQVPGGELVLNGEPAHAVAEADVIYTDVWASMGQEAEADRRRHEFSSFQVNAALLRLAPAHVRVMHCLPAHREEEVTSEVLDGSHSIVVQQAANRMHAQKALLKWLLA
jgi:ornithine carbamoyltransferase